MAITINWGTRVINVPQSFLTLISGTSYSLDTNAFHIALKDLEDSEEGIAFPPTHNHNTTVLLGGVEYARIIEFINGYSITFEDGVYSVSLIGSNNNILDVVNLNQVSIRANNSAGLVVAATDTSGVAAAVLAAALVTPIYADTRRMNGATVQGVGTSGDLWRGV